MMSGRRLKDRNEKDVGEEERERMQWGGCGIVLSGVLLVNVMSHNKAKSFVAVVFCKSKSK